MRSSGAWHDQILTDFFDRNAAAHPDATAIVAGHQAIRPGSPRFPMPNLQLRPIASRSGFTRSAFARAISSRSSSTIAGNFSLSLIACIRIGAITHPIMPILRHRELIFMSRLTEARLSHCARSLSRVRFRDDGKGGCRRGSNRAARIHDWRSGDSSLPGTFSMRRGRSDWTSRRCSRRSGRMRTI